MMALPPQALEFAFTAGLNQKLDPRVIEAPELVRAVDVDFDSLGGLRLRYPYSSIGATIFGGGTISGCRRVYEVGDELILFTQTGLYSWSSQRSAWVLKGTHLAAKVKESAAFINSSDQSECDRAELSGTVLYVWSQLISGASQVYYAAADNTTGAVLLTPQSISVGQRPRVIALTTTFIIFNETSTGNLLATAIDPSTLALTNAVVLAAAAFNSYYDVEKIPGSDNAIVAARRDVTTSYEILKVSAVLAVTASTKARVCDGPISITCTPDGNYAQIARGNATAIEGDLVLVSSLADVNTAQALGSGTSTINQITAAFVDNTTCRVFWHSNESTNGGAYDIDTNTVTVASSVGTAARLIYRLSLASRAFAYNGEAFVWTVFAGVSSFSGASPSKFSAALQNTYFLYRADGHMVARAATQQAGGFQTTALLPGVALTSGTTVFSWAGTERRVIPIGKDGIQTVYSDRGPRDIAVTFDSNEARRVAKFGRTVYIAGGGITLQYDGQSITEVGFLPFPWSFGAIEVGAGSVANGVFTYKVTLRFDNARGERERSTTATHGQVTIAGGPPRGVNIPNGVPLHSTRKTGVVIEIWRTAVNGSAPFYLVTSPDPTATTNPNRAIENDTTAANFPTYNDEFAEATLTTKEPSPENDSVLENLAPPGATLIMASDSRLFISGIPNLPHVVAYSKQRNEGEVAAFNDALVVQIPETGGDITGMVLFERIPIVFRQTAIYALDGQGFDNASGGQNFEARPISPDCGAISQESIVVTPEGIMFKSSKGWYLLRAPQFGATEYIGGKVRNYDSETVHSALVVEAQHQVRIVTSARVLLYDYLAKAWSEWSITDGLHACNWNGTYHYLATASVKAEQTSYSTADYGWDVEMLIHLGGLQGFARVQEIQVLGEVRGSGTVRLRAGTYQEGTYFDDKTWTISPITVGAELAFRHGPSQQQHKAVRVRLTSQAAAGEKPKLSAITLKVVLKNSTYRHLPAAQKQ